ncbi:ABC transporter substrate-binding protein [Halorussus sp. MSC15.2]|uniref:ABC transporter substrate-binding protein n=1 Tax=Halorussus sp. MSC15.2 TaxID=2283638 RepID=UPI0013D19385|nr:ABC transporter substrate-binding protein [Halorussus sp. MSC15.2]NEU58854.1 ABC transporter substrate-binding protein [Halorussus sp. MSC15.2]
MTSNDTSVTRRNLLKAAGGAAASASVAGYVDTDEANDVQQEGSGTVTYARGNDSGTLDPQNTTSGEDVKVTNQLYDTLIEFEPNKTTLQEGLATQYSMDGTTVNLTLREGVTFHNGDEFTAEDFVATYRRFTDSDYQYYPGDSYISAYGPFTLGNWVENVSAGGSGAATTDGGQANETDAETTTAQAGGGQGSYTLTIELNEPYAPFLRNLAMFASSVLSRRAIERHAQDQNFSLSNQPVGTGAFQFESWDTGNQRIRLSRNPDYWGEGPYVNEVVFTAIGSNTTRAQTLISGGADIIDGIGAQASQIVRNADAAELVETQGINIGYLAMNMARREEFRNKKVRQAISYAVDTEAIVNTIFRGIAEQASQPIPQKVLGYNESIDPYPHDPDQAQQLLEGAGYENGFEFELATFKNPRTYNPSPIQAAQTVKSNLNEVGITVNINQQPFNPFLTYTEQGKHDACFLGWMTDNADPDNFYYALLHPQVSEDKLQQGQDWVSWDTEGFNTLDVAAWANREFMQLTEQAQSTLDRDKRAELYKQAGQLAHDEAPWVFIDHAKELRGVANRVQDFQIAPISGPLLNRVKVEG